MLRHGIVMMRGGFVEIPTPRHLPQVERFDAYRRALDDFLCGDYTRTIRPWSSIVVVVFMLFVAFEPWASADRRAWKNVRSIIARPSVRMDW
jgi:hypothetical protein